jgi:hypothetical protein
MPKPTKNPGEIKFEGLIQPDDSGSPGWVDFPFDLKELYGIGNLVPVVIYFDEVEYRGSIAKMGRKYPMLLLRKDIAAQVNKKPGEKVQIRVILDDKPRTVEIPVELNRKFKNNALAKDIFDKLAFSHRREYAQWINEGKKPETRERRAQQAIEQIIQRAK